MAFIHNSLMLLTTVLFIGILTGILPKGRFQQFIGASCYKWQLEACLMILIWFLLIQKYEVHEVISRIIVGTGYFIVVVAQIHFIRITRMLNRGSK